jgi:phosphatidylglycerol:prolipoprotein diacylglycerol transferase
VIFPQSGTFEPRHPSQLYAALAEGLLPFVILLPFHARHRRPGLTMGACFALYSIARISDEFFREPDHNRFLIGWLTKGQALTIPLAVLAVGLITYASTRPPRPELYPAPPEPAPPEPSAHRAGDDRRDDAR